MSADYEAGTAPSKTRLTFAFVVDNLTTHATAMLDWFARTRAALDEWPRHDDAGRAERAVAGLTKRVQALPTLPIDR